MKNLLKILLLALCILFGMYGVGVFFLAWADLDSKWCASCRWRVVFYQFDTPGQLSPVRLGELIPGPEMKEFTLGEDAICSVGPFSQNTGSVNNLIDSFSVACRSTESADRTWLGVELHRSYTPSKLGRVFTSCSYNAPQWLYIYSSDGLSRQYGVAIDCK